MECDDMNQSKKQYVITKDVDLCFDPFLGGSWQRSQVHKTGRSFAGYLFRDN